MKQNLVMIVSLLAVIGNISLTLFGSGKDIFDYISTFLLSISFIFLILIILKDNKNFINKQQ